jgi:PIN domain nuclease of toxin-antitoxin system
VSLETSGPTILLDSHVVVWWQAGGDRLSRVAHRRIDGADRLLVSPMTCWEITTLHRQGRLRLDRDPLRWVGDLLRQRRVEVASLTPEAAAWAGLLGGDAFPGDPIDRLLYATAHDLRVPFLTTDERIRSYAAGSGDVDVVW